jgi:hypothetical protein
MVAAAPVATAGGRTRPLDPQGQAGREALAALGVPASQPTAPPATAVPAVAECGAESAADGCAGGFGAWRWDGTAAVTAAVPDGVELPAAPARLAVDLRGDGQPLWAELDTAGVVTVRDGAAPDAPVVWRNERPGWRFARVVAGDPNDDGRKELLLLLVQPDEAGRLRTQPYLLGYRGGAYRIIWGGSPTVEPIQDLAWADLDGDGRGELVALEGGAAPGQPGRHVSVWGWHGWGFELHWRSAPGRWSRLGLLDLDGDGRAEIVAAP